MCWSLGRFPLESPVWTGLLPKEDQVLRDVHLEGVFPRPLPLGWAATASGGEQSCYFSCRSGGRAWFSSSSAWSGSRFWGHRKVPLMATRCVQRQDTEWEQPQRGPTDIRSLRDLSAGRYCCVASPLGVRGLAAGSGGMEPRLGAFLPLMVSVRHTDMCGDTHRDKCHVQSWLCLCFRKTDWGDCPEDIHKVCGLVKCVQISCYYPIIHTLACVYVWRSFFLLFLTAWLTGSLIFKSLSSLTRGQTWALGNESMVSWLGLQGVTWR